MPRVIKWVKMECGAMLRTTTTTWNRAEVLARVKAVNSFRHKRIIVKQYKEYVNV